MDQPTQELQLGAGPRAHRAADASAAEATVAAGVLGEVLLVVVLGVVEVMRDRDLGSDRPQASTREHLLVGVARGFGRGALRIVAAQQYGSVLRAGVVALAHPLCGV